MHRGFIFSYMKKLIFVVNTIAIFVFASCTSSVKMVEVKSHGETMGSDFNITYLDSAGRDLSGALDSLLLEFNAIFSTYDSTSVISQFNDSDTGIALIGSNLEWFTRLMIAADSVYQYSHGAFNPAVAPLVKYWGFYGKQKSLEVDASQKTIDSLLVIAQWENIYQYNQFLKKKNPKARLDVNAFAPGFAADLLGEFLEYNNIHNYLIEIGGEVRARGVNANKHNWTVAIMQPEELTKQYISTIALQNKALATSGNYNKYVMVEGKRYGHTINPHTGYPETNNLLSATIITDEGIYADAFATACMVMGFENAKQFVENNASLQAYFIYTDAEDKMQTWYSSGLKDLVEERKN